MFRSATNWCVSCASETALRAWAAGKSPVYHINEVFYSIQGEGARSGRAAVFCRFSGCNLWSGREEDRHRATCAFCDTDFVGVTGPGGGRFDERDRLAEHVLGYWPGGRNADLRTAYVVCTGGEPLLQLDDGLVDAFHQRGFEVAVETNGTRPAPSDIDWLCVSPKGKAALALNSGQELKLVFPQEAAPPERFEGLDFEHFFLQPMDGPDLAKNTRAALNYCRRNPRWRIGLQMHKVLGIR